MVELYSNKEEEDELLLTAHKNFPIKGEKFIISKSSKKSLLLTNTPTYEIFQKLKDNPALFSLGISLGSINENTFTPSLYTLYSFPPKFKAVNLKHFGAQHFLFGRNINFKSIQSSDKSISEGDELLVLDTKNKLLGLGKSLINFSKATDEKSTIIKNKVDFGWYLRHR